MHKALKEIVSTYSDPKKVIEKSVETIRCDIDTIYCDLKCYVEDELPKINKQIQDKKLEFDQQLECSCGKLSSEILIVKKTLTVTRKITYSLKTTIKTMSQIKGGSSQQIEYILEEITGNFEKTVSSRIENILQRICDYIEELPSTLCFPDLNCLTYDNFDDHKKISEIEDYIRKLDRVIKYIKRRKVKLGEIIEKYSQNVKTTERSGERYEKKIFSEQTGGLQTKSMEFQLSYQTEVTKIEKLINVKDTISELLKVVCCDIDKLEKEITSFKDKLETVKGELLRLKEIKELNETLIGYKGGTPVGQQTQCPSQPRSSTPSRPSSGTPKLTQMRDKTEKLNYNNNGNTNKIDNIEYFKGSKCQGGSSQNDNYSQHVNEISETVDKLLPKLELNEADKPTNTTTNTSGSSSNPNLTRAKEALKHTQTKLTNLTRYGKNIRNLEYITKTITKLKEIDKEIQQVKTDGQVTKQSCAHGSNSFYEKLTYEETKLQYATRKLQLIERNINSISKVNPDLETLNNLHNNLVNLSLNAQSIGQLNEGLKAIENLELTKDVHHKLTKELEDFKVKLSGIGRSLTVVSAYLYFYSKKQNNGEIGVIKDSIEINIRDKIVPIKGNISKITEAGKKIAEHYSKYTAKFEEFNKALKELETCLDYLVERFLRCSLCTTICRLKRQLRDTSYTNYPNTNTNNNSNTKTISNTSSECLRC